jgi:hypothetical protein
MSDIYMKKKIFWEAREQNGAKNLAIFVISISVVVLITALTLNDHKASLENKDEHSVDFNQTIASNDTGSHEVIDIVYLVDNKSEIQRNKHFKYNPLVCLLFEKELDEINYNKHVRKRLFSKCTMEEESKEIELYYNFRMNKPKEQFVFSFEHSAEITKYNNHICFISGKAHVALETKSIPMCIEFKNIRFSTLNKNDFNLLFKFHIFQTNNNKVHIYPASKQLINNNLIRMYINSSNLVEERNILIYNNKEDRYLRICNILSRIDQTYYENNFWLELVWNPDKQNLLCIENIEYIN